MRVVSLLPSATEVVCALGVAPVGVTHECDYPPRVEELPTVVNSRIDTDGSSTDIDDQVQAAVSAGGVYELDRERLRELDPDVVITQGLCDVCAVDETVVRDTISELDLDAELVASHPHSLADVLEDIERIGAVLGRTDEASALVADLESRIEAVRAQTPETTTSVAVFDWLDPVMVAGHWVPDLVAAAGGEFAVGTPGDESGPIEFEQVRDADPDVIIVAPCGFSADRTESVFTDLTARPGWDDLRAVRTNRVFIVDGNHYVNRPGPRLFDTLEAFAALIHPDRFDSASTEMVRRPPERPEST